jgi:uncharacterized protein YbaP (TraB family)
MAVALIAAALAAASVPATPAPAPIVADADPAIWVVNDRDTVIFLFGTFHALDGKSDWFNDEVRTAFASSDELVLETIVPDLAAPVPQLEPEAPGTTPPRKLSFAPPASFLASTRMAISAGRAKGLNVRYGADAVLRQAAETSGKYVGGLESFDFQLNMFARIPGNGAGRAHVTEDPAAKEAMGVLMGEMQTAWNRGDQAIFAAMLEQMRTNSPETYKLMFTERNSNWAGWIANRLQTPGTVFVAVGTGHLVGHDSVQAKLARLGVRSARIN